MEAAEGGVKFIVAVTEGVPAHDEAIFYSQLERMTIPMYNFGPNCRNHKSRQMQYWDYCWPHPLNGGPVGIVSRSGTLTYQALYELKQKDIGVTTCVGIGGDPVPGTSFIDCLEAFEADPETKAIMMIGEIGGSAEEEAAEYTKDHVTKPVSSYIAGVTAPPGRKWDTQVQLCPAEGTAKAKMEALEAAGVRVGNNPTKRRTNG